MVFYRCDIQNYDIYGEAFAAAGVDIVMTGDDVANQRGLTMSVPMWKDYLQPHLAETVAAEENALRNIEELY